MKPIFPHVVIMASIIHASASNDSIKEICDVEGTVVEDCPVEMYCCSPSECNEIFYGNVKQSSYIDIEDEIISEGYNKRCCNSSERMRDPKPNNCKICKECCDEVERNKHPLPNHCSKCHRCQYSGNTSVLQQKLFQTGTVQRTG